MIWLEAWFEDDIAVAPQALEGVVSHVASKKFITESELEQIKQQRGGGADDESAGSMKPLAEILRENKARKDEEFKNVWKSMKQGKNRPLDEDELDHLNRLAEGEAAREMERKREEEMELEEFRRQAQAIHGQEEQGVAAVGPSLPPPNPSHKRPAPAPIAKPLLKIIKQKEGTVKKQVKEPAAASNETKDADGGPESGEGLTGLLSLADYGDEDE